MFPAGVVADDNNVSVIRLREPIENGVTGSVTFTDHKKGKSTVIDIDKLKDRQIIELPTHAAKDVLLNETVKVSLQRGKYSESWEIPFIESPAGRR